MGFLKFCCIKLIKTFIGVIIVLGVILGYALLHEHAPWINYLLIGVVIAYIFLRCWWEDYEKTKKYRESYGYNRKKRK